MQSVSADQAGCSLTMGDELPSLDKEKVHGGEE